MNTRARRRLLLAGSALATLAVLTACGSTGATARIVRPPPLAAAAARSVSSTVGVRSDSASESAVS